MEFIIGMTLIAISLFLTVIIAITIAIIMAIIIKLSLIIPSFRFFSDFELSLDPFSN